MTNYSHSGHKLTSGLNTCPTAQHQTFSSFRKKWGGEELSTPINIIAQELCNNIRMCLVAKSITVQELQRAKEEFMCHTTHELYDEMELWQWDEVQHNRWARALKSSHRMGVRPIWYVEEAEQEGTSCAAVFCNAPVNAETRFASGVCPLDTHPSSGVA